MTIYIDMYDALKEFKPDEWGTPDERVWPENKVAAYLITIPPADVQPVVSSSWEFLGNGDGICQHCGSLQKHIWDLDGWQNFCGHCGADMREG